MVVIGNSSNGMDISREIALVAKEVHWSARTWPANVDLQKRVGALNNIILHPMVCEHILLQLAFLHPGRIWNILNNVEVEIFYKY